MKLNGTPYLPTVGWYRSWVASVLEGVDIPCAGASPNKSIIRGAWGEQTLTVPIEGGRRRLNRTPYDKLTLSEHGNWRHTHCHALVSAYGGLPYFPYFSDSMEKIYAVRHERLQELNEALHRMFLNCSGLEESLAWIKEKGQQVTVPVLTEVPDHICALELLFRYGKEVVFHLMPHATEKF